MYEIADSLVDDTKVNSQLLNTGEKTGKRKFKFCGATTSGSECQAMMIAPVQYSRELATRERAFGLLFVATQQAPQNATIMRINYVLCKVLQRPGWI